MSAGKVYVNDTVIYTDYTTDIERCLLHVGVVGRLKWAMGIRDLARRIRQIGDLTGDVFFSPVGEGEGVDSGERVSGSGSGAVRAWPSKVAWEERTWIVQEEATVS
ncbi:hypothetical protein HDU76_005127 [Blyttiomyces sp. JEL0837]|nr:hypothetical protein HDU76_005127 [Blyttiomyces sp. JEL0837]